MAQKGTFVVKKSIQLAKKLFLGGILSLWLLWSCAVLIFHWGTLPQKDFLALQKIPITHSALWIKSTPEFPMQHLVLEGSAFERGWLAGQHTQHLLYEQEKELTTLLKKVFPYRFLFQTFELALIPLFKGTEKDIPRDFLEEMYGVSLATSAEFAPYAEAFTRQLAYHGLYEVGQMMVDQFHDDRLENMGCTAVLAQQENSWMVGRNFDFEGGPTLDEKKILKWVFPEGKYAYLSVIWAGMVGSVTAVNEHGLYLSINAAGTQEFRRQGVPTTLLLTRVMDSARNSDEALQLLQNTPTISSALFVLVSARENKAFRVEKSPNTTRIIPIAENTAITNHFISADWDHDPINLFRKEELTSQYRQARGQELAHALTPQFQEKEMAEILRDKHGLHNAPRSLGHRQSIDSLIANHSVIYNGEKEHIYVSVGPHLINDYLGYDLKASFQQRRPQFVQKISADPEVTPEIYENYLGFQRQLEELAQHLHTNKDVGWLATSPLLREMQQRVQTYPQLENSTYNELLGQLARRQNQKDQAKKYFLRALQLVPAYKREQTYITEVLHAL